jgi:ParB/RepB/Spo0J family partition protein
MTTKKQAKAAVSDIPVAAIRENTWNGPREADEGLVASVRQDGVLEAIRVVDQGKDGYLLVYGARRLDAARKSGLKTIPAVVLDKKTTEKEMRELNLVENIHRLAQRPIQEGRIFKELVGMGKSVAQIAAAVNKSKGYVNNRIVLTNLCPQAEELVEQNGTYSVEAVCMLAALPPERQVELVERSPHLVDNASEMRSAIRRTGTLDNAPFDPEDADLDPEAGPCTKCAKRTGADTLLFGEEDWESDTCLDKGCYARKCAAKVARDIAKLRKKTPTAPCVVEKWAYNYTTSAEEKALYDAHDAKPPAGMDIVYQKPDDPDARPAIDLSHGKARQAWLVPAKNQQKDGRAAKPKTPEEKAAFLEKKRRAWIAKMVQADIATTISPYCEEESAALWMRRLAEAAGMKDMSLQEAAGFLFQKLSNFITGHLYCDTIGMIDVEKKREAALRALRAIFGDEDADKMLDELQAKAADAVK